MRCVSRVGILVCKWLFQMIHDVNAISAFDYILPLMVSLFTLSVEAVAHHFAARTCPLHGGERQ